MRTEFEADTEAARELIARARELQAREDAAFRRYLRGETTASAASRARNRAAEAWADVRLQIRGGDEIEARENA